MQAVELGTSRERDTSCNHSGLHSPLGRYVRDAAEIRYTVVCDDCGAETGEVHRETYRPNFDPAGNDPYIAQR